MELKIWVLICQVWLLRGCDLAGYPISEASIIAATGKINTPSLATGLSNAAANNNKLMTNADSDAVLKKLKLNPP